MRGGFGRFEAGQKVRIRHTDDRLIVTAPGEGAEEMSSYSIDGRENTNVRGPATITTRTNWDGVALVTSGTAKCLGRVVNSVSSSARSAV